MKTPHKHADVIKAWADGAEVECRQTESGTWLTVRDPAWSKLAEYRIKTQPKPDVVQYAKAELSFGNVYIYVPSSYKGNLKLTFDGETGKLKSAEVI